MTEIFRMICPCIYNKCCRPKIHQDFRSNTGRTTTVELNGTGISATPMPEVAVKRQTSRTIVRALYNFEPRQSDEIAFSKGDRMEVITKGDNSDWWTVKNLTTKQIGYAPSNYVAVDDNRPESQDWWFSVDRREADKQLLLPGNPKGTFLIRNSSDNKTYALSIRNFDETLQTVTIKHYRIHKKPEGVCITEKLIFSNLLELVQHYRRHADGLCCALSKACPQEPVPVPFKEIEVGRNDIELAQKLGSGNFGEVWAGKLFKTVDVAVKTLKPGTMTVEGFLNEAKAMHRLRHRKLVQLMGVCTMSEPYYIITELMVNGSLLDYIQLENNHSKLTREIIIDMAAQIGDGMQFLELQNFIHRDLRAANILVGENHTVKVADFGLARLVKGTAKVGDGEQVYNGTENAQFPIKWTAPEAISSRTFSIKSDVWSFGILLYEMITFGRTPYPGMTNLETIVFVNNGGRLARPTGCVLECPVKFYDVMKHCWQSSPQERPTFEYLYHFFDSFGTAAEGQYAETHSE